MELDHGIGSWNCRFVDDTPVAMPIKEQPLVGPYDLLPTAAEEALPTAAEDAEAAAAASALAVAAAESAAAAAALSPAA